MKDFDEMIEFQKKYRDGKIKEKEIPNRKLIELKKLYNMQIELLQESIEEDKRKILKLRKNINI